MVLELKSGTAGTRLESITNSFSNVMEASLSANGGRCAIMVQNTPSKILYYPFDPDEGQITGEPQRRQGRFDQPHTSPDGDLAYVSPPPREDILVTRRDGTRTRRLTDDLFRDRGPQWSPPDGRWLTFYSNRSGSYEIWLMKKDDTRRQQLTNDPTRDLVAPCWSKDGKRIAFTNLAKNSTTRFLALEEPLSDINEPLLPEELSIDNFSGSAWSPDNSYIIGEQVRNEARISAVYDFKNDKTQEVMAPDGKPHAAGIRGRWIDARQFIIVDDLRKGVFLCNIETGESRLLLQLDGVLDVDIADSGQTLIITQSLVEAEVWTLDLEVSDETTAQ